MESEHRSLGIFSAMEELRIPTDSADFFLFSTDPDAPADSSPTVFSEAVERLNKQYRYFRDRNQRLKADDTLLQVLQLHTAHHSDMILDTLGRIESELFSYSPAFGEVVENCAWDTFLYMQERQPDSLITLNLIVLYCSFLQRSGYYQREISKERLTAVADFLIPRCDKFVAEVLSALMGKLNGHITTNIEMYEVLGKAAVLLKREFATGAERCGAFILILSCHSANIPSQRQDSEKLLKLALLEAMQDRVSNDLNWCGQVLRNRVVERNFQSAEVLEVWFVNATSLRKSKFLRENYALWLRQLYRNS